MEQTGHPYPGPYQVVVKYTQLADLLELNHPARVVHELRPDPRIPGYQEPAVKIKK